MSGYTPFKMKGSGLYGKGNQSPAKTHEKGHGPQQGPINAPKNKKLHKGEMEGTGIYKGTNKSEMINDFEDRAEFAGEDANTSPGPERDAALKRQKNLEREAQIIRDRKGKKSPAKIIPLVAMAGKALIGKAIGGMMKKKEE